MDSSILLLGHRALLEYTFSSINVKLSSAKYGTKSNTICAQYFCINRLLLSLGKNISIGRLNAVERAVVTIIFSNFNFNKICGLIHELQYSYEKR